MEAASLRVWMVQHWNMGFKKEENYALLGPGPKFKIQFEDLMIVNFAQTPTLQGRRNWGGGGGGRAALLPPAFSLLVSAL